MKKNILIIGIIILTILLSGCTQNTSDNNGTNSNNNNSSEDQNESTIQAYPGGTSFTIPSDLKSNFNIPTTTECIGYGTDDDPLDVLEWYEEQMTQWTLLNQSNNTPPDNPESTMYIQYYKNADEGVFLFVIDNFMQSKTLIGIATGTWSTIQTYGFNQPSDGGPDSSNNQNEDVDWTNAHKITDPVGDFWLGGGSPSQIIDFPASDIISINITNDDTNLYIKFTMNGAIPTFPVSENNDIVRILVMDTIIDTDNNPSTGHVMNFNGGEIAIEAWFGSPTQAQGTMYTFTHYCFYDSNGEEGVGTWHDCTRANGGQGETYVTISCPLEDINLQKGDKINAIIFAEAESDKYHHYARDVINNDDWTGPITIQ